jgi:aspartate dehydrogenase
MSGKLKIGIVGCGAIGSSLAKAVARDFRRQAELVALYDIDDQKSRALSRLVSKKRNLAAKNLAQLIRKAELVIEAASARSSWEIARKVLARKRSIMIMSVGGIATYLEKITALAKRYKVKVYIPSGAISGIDALKAARLGKIKKVTLTTRKNPVSFKGVKYIESKRIRLDKIRQDKVLFSGPALEAVKYFPQNINVAAVLSLAGIGAQKTQVRIVASPRVKKNIHEIEIESEAARIFTRSENILHPQNPKTSYLAVLSAIATLKQILEPIKIGT